MNEETENLITICGYCQKQFGIDITGVTNISHGVCTRHAVEMLKSMGLDGAAQKFAQNHPGKDDKDLSDPELLAAKKAEIDAAKKQKA